MDAGVLLSNTLSPDAAIRKDAEAQLERAALENYPEYMALLANQMVNEGADINVRIAAGLAIKNTLSVRDPTRAAELATRWQALAPEARLDIKSKALQTLTTQLTPVATQAAQVIAAIAAIEIPLGQWPDLLNQLLAASSDEQNAKLRQSALQTIGFVCENLQNSDALRDQSNQILTAVIRGAHKDEPVPDVQLAALHALLNSLEFVSENFAREGERNYIMQVVCEDTQHARTDIKVAAFEVLVKIMPLYYSKMRMYMEQALFGITVLGMKDSEPEVALQAIEFWSTVCETEIQIEKEAQDSDITGIIPQQSYQFAQATCGQVVPPLLDLLKTQDEDADEDEWTVAKAAGVATGLFAQAARDSITPLVIPYIEANIKTENWHDREAAVMAFGSILLGPSDVTLQPLVQSALPAIIGMLQDPSVEVRDTSAWTLGRITDLHVQTIETTTVLPELIRALLAAIHEQPRIAMNCAWAVMNLSEQLLEADSDSSFLSPFLPDIVENLLTAADKDTNESNARTSSYEALAVVAAQAPKDALHLVSRMLVVVMERQERLNALVSQLVGLDDRNNWAELQSNLSSVTTAVVRRLGAEIAPVADQLMTNLLTLIHTGASTPGMSTVMEDAFLAIAAVILALEAGFAKYLDAFQPFMVAALQNHEDFQLCAIAVGIIGDICRALGKTTAPYCDSWIKILFENLSSAALSREVKPPILSSFGDIALSLGAGFEPYLQATMTVLAQAATIQPTDDVEMQDYVILLREGICDSYVGIVSGVRMDQRADILIPYVEGMFLFIKGVHDERQTGVRSEQLLAGALGLLGDLATTFPNGELRPALAQDWVPEFVRDGRSKNYEIPTRQVATWARDQVSKAISAA